MKDTTVVLHTLSGNMFTYETNADDARGLIKFVTGCWNAGRSLSLQVATNSVTACVNTSHISMITTSPRPTKGS
jgi:hypothetical protein